MQSSFVDRKIEEIRKMVEERIKEEGLLKNYRNDSELGNILLAGYDTIQEPLHSFALPPELRGPKSKPLFFQCDEDILKKKCDELGILFDKGMLLTTLGRGEYLTGRDRAFDLLLEPSTTMKDNRKKYVYFLEFRGGDLAYLQRDRTRTYLHAECYGPSGEYCGQRDLRLLGTGQCDEHRRPIPREIKLEKNRNVRKSGNR